MFKEVEYEQALGQLVVATRELLITELPPATERIKFSTLLKSFYMLANWTYSGNQCDFKYRRRTAGQNVFVGLPNVYVYALPGNLHSAFSERVWLGRLVMKAVMYSHTLLRRCFCIFQIWCFVRSWGTTLSVVLPS